MASAAGRRNILRELNEAVMNDSPSSHQSVIFPPTPTSPDEQVIQHRGRKKKVVQTTLDIFTTHAPKTPTKSPRKSPVKARTPTKYPITPTRSSPRKRLNLTTDLDLNDSYGIEDMDISERPAKKARLQFSTEVSVPKTLLALSHTQLLELVKSVAATSSVTKQVVTDLIPVPDLESIELRLYNLQRNIFKAYPRNVYGSQTDAFCYNRVRTHIEIFKKECTDQGRILMESEHWSTVFDFLLMAFKLASGLPDWACPGHNKIKEQVIRNLATFCNSALKKAKLDSIALGEIKERLNDLDLGNSVATCLVTIQRLQKKA